jgi:serine/threonine-protein kinase
MDFGIARSLAVSGLTQVGETVGTPHFMSPEQAAGDTVDGRSDLYSLGVVSYFAVTGRLPFEADSAQAVMVAHISQAPVPVSRYRPDLPPPLANTIDRCLEKAPTDRFATGEALVEALEQVRARRIEVPPAIRVWTVRSDQFFRIGLVLSLLLPQMLRIGGSEGAKVIFMGLVFAGTVPALLAQIPIGMRELARQGFSYADLRQGILAIDGEREAVVAATQADPRYGRRRRNRLLALFGGFVLSVAIAVLAATSGTETEPGRFRVSPFALYVTAIAVCAGMVFLVLAIGILASSGRIDRRIHRLWTGKVGAALYRLASWRIPHPATTNAPAGGRGAATLFTSLDPTLKRRLPGAKATLARLDKALADLDLREQGLEAAATEAKLNAPTLPGAVSAQQQTLLNDLDRARREVVERRVGMLGALENIRLALVRLKSGLGATDLVEAELREAERLLGG